ncbi:probable myosin light chain kinase DDB_G0271550 [Macrobrachium nipponense]|uniref:probable myosin light chain kinase DDB_G0271550 n=1 Tax=Macrobrachium nipponense TaxID=159736 RepID=UPI0030C7EB3F
MVLIGYYHFGMVLGRGKFGWVSQATHRVVGHYVAVKHQPWAVGGDTCGGASGKHVDCQHADETQWRAALENEAELLARISHPSVVALLEVVRKPSELYLCLEYLGEITLASMVSQDYEEKGAGLAEPEAACIFKQVAAGLHHLHCEGILHRDVKPENIMIIPSHNGEMPIAKLIDLGLAALWDPLSPLNTSCTRAGTVVYMAPELTSSAHVYGPEVDVFSLGASLYYALIGEIPFMEYLRNGKRGTTAVFGLQLQHEEALDSLTREAVGLLRSMLDANPSKRCTLPQVCGHTWIIQEYIPSSRSLGANSSLIVDCHGGLDISGLFSVIGKDYFCGESDESSEFGDEAGSSEELVFVKTNHSRSIASTSSSSLGTVSKLRIRSSSSNNIEDTKDILVNMECVDRVSSLLQKDNDHVLQHLGEEPWGPVGGIYNLLLHAGLVQQI